MKIILWLSLLFSSIAVAQTPSPKVDQYNRFKTVIVNGGFENEKSNWSASGGSFSISTSSGNLRSGLRGAVFNSSVTAQTLTSSANTMSSGNNQVSCWFKTTATDYKFQAWDGANVLAEQTIPALSQFTKLVLNVGMSAPGQLMARIISASDAADLFIDDCMSGEADNVGNGNFATDWQSFTPTGTWVTNTTWTGKKRRVADTGEYDVLISLSGAPTTASLAINLPTGEVIDSSKVTSTSDDYSALGTCAALDSGSGAFLGTVAYVSTTAVRVKFIATANANNNSQIQVDQASPMTFANGDRINCTFKAPIVGWNAQTVFNPDTIAWRVDANIGGANPSLGTSAVTSYTGVESASIDMVQNTMSIPVQIPCSSTNASTGLTCSTGNESVGVVFNLPRAGSVLACASFTHSASLNTSGDAINTAFQIVETPNNAQTILQEGKTRVTAYSSDSATGSVGQQKPFRLCGTFYFSSVGQKTLRLMFEQTVTGSPGSSLVVADRDANTGQRDIHWEVYPIDQAIPAPLLIGMPRVAKVLCSSSSSITSQSGAWISSIGNISSGTCTLTLRTGEFGTAPVCIMNVDAANGGATVGAQVSVASTTSMTITGSYNIGGTTTTNTSMNAYLMCIEPK